MDLINTINTTSTHKMHFYQLGYINIRAKKIQRKKAKNKFLMPLETREWKEIKERKVLYG